MPNVPARTRGARRTSAAQWADTRAAAAAYLAEKRDSGAIKPLTHRQMRYQLEPFVDLCISDPSKISRRDVIRWLKANGHLSANSRRQYFNRIHGFTDWLNAGAPCAPTRSPRFRRRRFLVRFTAPSRAGRRRRSSRPA